MKTLLFVFGLLALPLAAMALEEAQPLSPAEECRAKVAFGYHFDMMKIEGEQMRAAITHREADEQKSRRHRAHRDELKTCDKLKK